MIFMVVFDGFCLYENTTKKLTGFFAGPFSASTVKIMQLRSGKIIEQAVPVAPVFAEIKQGLNEKMNRCNAARGEDKIVAVFQLLRFLNRNFYKIQRVLQSPKPFWLTVHVKMDEALEVYEKYLDRFDLPEKRRIAQMLCDTMDDLYDKIYL